MIKNTIAGAVILCLLTVFALIIPTKPSILSMACGIGIALIIIIHFIATVNTKKERIDNAAFWIPLLSLSVLFVILPVVFAAALYLWGTFSLISWVLLISLSLVFYYNFLTIPLAIYHKRLEIKKGDKLACFPSLTVLIPAYNEEKVLRRTIETVLEATYHDKEIIVIDDGSTDNTYQIARCFYKQGVKVIRRPNGGKAVALNHGLRFARGEVVVVVDADSMVGKHALLEIVQPFVDPAVAAVAGNIKVINRMNWLTKCQALEYIASINLYRRALDVFGSVTVVPGAIGAYRREVLESGGYYDSDTLVEDFDVTVKALKTGKIIQASTRAISYTEAPQTLRDIIKQRQRWYRGNFQAMWKHRDAVFNSRYGFLQKLSFPYMVMSMMFTPLAGVVSIAAAIIALLNGGGHVMAPTVIFFFVLQLLISWLALQLEGEDRKLTFYAPLFIIGYKQLCDFIIMKSMLDVIFRRDLRWTSVRRTGTEVSRSALS